MKFTSRLVEDRGAQQNFEQLEVLLSGTEFDDLANYATEDYVDGGDEATLEAAEVYADTPPVPETISGNYTAVLADTGKTKLQTSGSASTFTVPPNTSVAFSLGTLIAVVQAGTGTVTLTQGAGVTINAPGGLVDTNVQHSVVNLLKTGTDTWLASGDLA